MTSDRPTPVGEVDPRDTIPMSTPVGWDEDRPATLPPESAVRVCQYMRVVGPTGEPL